MCSASSYFKLNGRSLVNKQLILEHDNEEEFYFSETIFPTAHTYQSKREKHRCHFFQRQCTKE